MTQQDVSNAWIIGGYLHQLINNSTVERKTIEKITRARDEEYVRTDPHVRSDDDKIRIYRLLVGFKALRINNSFENGLASASREISKRLKKKGLQSGTEDFDKKFIGKIEKASKKLSRQARSEESKLKHSSLAKAAYGKRFGNDVTNARQSFEDLLANVSRSVGGDLVTYKGDDEDVINDYLKKSFYVNVTTEKNYKQVVRNEDAMKKIKFQNS